MPRYDKIIAAADKVLSPVVEEAGNLLRAEAGAARAVADLGKAAARPGTEARIGRFLDNAKPELFDLTAALKDGIASNRWSTIIGEGTSGRIPSVFVWNQAAHRAAALGEEGPQLLFVSSNGKGGLWKQHIAAMTEEIEQSANLIPHGRALIVTDHILSANTLSRITPGLKSIGRPYDIAAVRAPSLEQLKAADAPFANFSSPNTRLYQGKVFSGIDNPMYLRGNTNWLRKLVGGDSNKESLDVEIDLVRTTRPFNSPTLNRAVKRISDDAYDAVIRN